MAYNLTLDKTIGKDTPLHKRLVQKIKSRIDFADRYHRERYDRWTKAEEQTLAYLPTSEFDTVRKNRRDKGKPQYTTIQIPYSYAMLMSAHTYWTSVFFARSPIHQFQGLHGEGEQQTQALEAITTYQVEVGGALGPYYIWLYDAGKYGVGILGTYWDKEKIQYGQVVQMENPDGSTALYQATLQVDGYEGNRFYNVSPFDFLHDPRVPVGRFQDGEFCAARRRLGWNAILRRQDQGYYNSNIQYLKEHRTPDRGATEGAGALVRPDFSREDFMDIKLDGTDDKHPAGAVFWEVYIDLVPTEWGLGSSTFPQKWCFTITEDLCLIVGASPLGYMHNKFPFDVLESEIEAYGVFNRGFPEIVEPIQNTIDWLLNTHFYNVRAAMNNQFIVDPSKLVVKDVKDAGAGFIWRLRPEAYGADISKMFYQIPVQDMTRGHVADIPTMLNFGEKVLGVNDQIMGSLNAGGRKTATEVRTSTGFGVNRLKTITEYMSATGFSPHAAKLVSTTQQCYDAEKKFRIAGDLALDAGQKFMMVTPDDIAGSYSFIPVDGVLPIDRMAQANMWKEILAGVRMMPPQIAAGFDWTRIFSWTAQIGGLKNINQFKIQVVPDQQVAQQVQAGNVIPMTRPGAPPLPPTGAAPGNDASTQAGLPSLAPPAEDYGG